MRKYVALKPQIGHRMDVFCALSHSEEAVWRFRLRVLRGRPMPSVTKRPLSPAGWLRARGQPGHSTRRQAFDSHLLFIDSSPEGVRCRAVHSSCDLQAVFDKVATCALCLFLTGEETAWKLPSWSCYSPKDNTFTRGEVLDWLMSNDIKIVFNPENLHS